MKKDEILHLANLSKLSFSDSEIESFNKDFDNILNFVSDIEKSNINSSHQPTIVEIDDLREDEIVDSLSQEDILKNAPEQAEGCFVVPQVV